MQKRLFLQAASAFFFSSVAAAAVPSNTTMSNNKKICVVYFSKTGHTRSVARSIEAFTGADLFEVQVRDPYPQDYRATTEVVKEELEKGIARPILPLAIDLTKYDTVVLGTPTWWHHTCMPLQTWMRSVDLSQKFVLTFNTHGGGGLMHTREDFEKLLARTRLGSHLTVFGSVVVRSPQVEQWLRENQLL